MKMIIMASIIIGLTSLRPESCDCHRILAVFPFVGRSHFVMFEELMKGLARNGHQVDVASTFPLKKPYPNYTDIIELPYAMPGLVNNMTYQAFESWSLFIVRWISTDIGNGLCKNLDHPEMQKIIKNPPNDPPYDMVITEYLTANCFIALGYHLKVPTVGLITSALYAWNYRPIANPPNLAFAPTNFLGYTAPMNFWERLCNTVNAIFNDLYFQYLTTPQTEIIRKHFGEDTPDIREIESSLDLVLVNSHPTIQNPRPITPALVEVGGLHIQDDGPELPKDLKEWMDHCKDGFIYFTFGSMMKIESFPENIVRIFYKSFKKIAPIKVLMKIPNPKELPDGMPENIRTFKWAPQFKVLQHKNVKAFISHGGLMGTQEAIVSGVPIIGIPLFADQFTNIGTMVKKNVAVQLEHQDLTEEKLDAALNSILYNPNYKKRMLEVAAEFNDRPMTALNTAIWWIEYVLRHGGKDLRSPAIDLHWWQVELLDVYGTILLFLIVLAYITILWIRFLLKRLFSIEISNKILQEKKDK